MKNPYTLILYHTVLAEENFDTAARALVELIAEAQRLHPNQDRVLAFDIEGHRNADGFDADMSELQHDFAVGFLLQFVTELRTPAAHADGVVLRNPTPQDNEVPTEFYITDTLAEAQMVKQIVEMQGTDYSVVMGRSLPATLENLKE